MPQQKTPKRTSAYIEAVKMINKGKKHESTVRALASEITKSLEPKNVTVKYDVKGVKYEESYDLLLVACLPAELNLTLTEEEQTVFHQESYTFQTTLIKAPVASDAKGDVNNMPSVRFSPSELNEMKGLAYGYRSETRKEFAGKLNDISEEYVTIYQLLDPANDEELNSKEALYEKLNADMKANVYKEWFPYDWSQCELVENKGQNPFHTRYFNHYDVKQVRQGENWDLVDLQGKNSTIFVHASTCFESVLHCYQYFEYLLEEKPKLLPKKKSAKILIVGAGPSGLLAARKLAQKGYQNIKILEKGEDYNGENEAAPFPMLAGKTQTYVKDQEDRRIPCELGTCYMSGAYDDMVDDLKDVTVGNLRLPLDQDYWKAPESSPSTGPGFRQITTPGQFYKDGPVMTLFNLQKLPLAYLVL